MQRTLILPHRWFLCSICLIKSTWNDLQWDRRRQNISTVTPLQTDLTPLGRSSYSIQLAGLMLTPVYLENGHQNGMCVNLFTTECCVWCCAMICCLFCNVRSQMLTQNDFAIITKLDSGSGFPSQRSAILQEQPEQVDFYVVILFSVKTRSSATAEKQRVSCACLPTLANWYTMHRTPQNRRGCVIFWHSNALLQEVLADTRNSHSRSFKIIHFAIICRSTMGTISSYNIVCRISEVFEDVAT